MKFMNRFKVVTVLFSFIFINGVCAKTVEYVEDAYTMQASKEIVKIVEKAALLVDFNDEYQVVSPKKAGIQINPWNKFLGQAINPQTKNPFIMVKTIHSMENSSDFI